MVGQLPESLAALLTPRAYPHPVEAIRLIETHVSWVLVTGELVYKIKRPVRYPFIDMRALEQRRFLCCEELRLNKRFAPELYLDVVQITRESNGSVRIGGQGEVIEYAVLMRQFDGREELDRLVAEARVKPDELAQFGRNLARIHEQLPRVQGEQQFGTATFVHAAILENLEQVEKLSRSAGLLFDSASLASAIRRVLDESATLMESRRAAGYVRECHGDLHCRNVVRRAGRLVAFDGLEFEPAFRWIDVAEEIAFLFMDLWRCSASAQATAFLNGYLGEGGDYEAVRLLRLYGAHRSLVRAKVAALESAASDHQSHVDCARVLLTPPQPTLVLMSGLSGSGKTWLAARLANSIGAIHVRSDVERKRLVGLHAQSRSGSGIDQGLYAHDINDRTYRRLAQCAADILSGKFTAILDATFQRRADRALVSRLAAACGARLLLIRCRAPAEVLRARIRDRQREGGDASEADLAVLERQQATFETLDPGEGLEVIDVDTTREGVVGEVEEKLRASV